MRPELLVVHCVDTEGPLYESLEATFERLRELYGVTLTPSTRNLDLLQSGRLDGVDSQTASAIAETFSRRNLGYNSNWTEIKSMLDELFTDAFRSRYADDAGSGWKFSWFILDHIGLEPNPRRKSQGWLQVFGEYWRRVRDFPGDEIQYHFHPTAISKNPTAAATSYLNNLSQFIEGLSRRLIEFGHFPTVFRPGFHSVRPDLNLLLELWFPFDYSNQAHEGSRTQPDERDGRFGDWNRAPLTWRGYSPSLLDYQSEGNLRRRTFRCLNVGTRFRTLNEGHVRQAFSEAERTGRSVLSFTNHDFRDIRIDVEEVHGLLRHVARDYENVVVRNSTAQQAAARVLGLSPLESPQGQCMLEGNRLRVTVDGEVFMAQPFLAVKTRDGRYLHDNFDLGAEPGTWTYTFDEYTVQLAHVEKIGVAVSGPSGGAWCQVLEV